MRQDLVQAGLGRGEVPRGSRLRTRILDRLRRHGVTAFGPVGVSAANFLATLAALHALSSREFGQFSFAIVVVGFCTSLTNGLLGSPLSSIAHVPAQTLRAELQTYFKASLIFAVLLGGAVLATLLGIATAPPAALLFGAYGSVMSLRLVARTYSYASNRVASVVISDSAYFLTLLAGAGALAASAKAGLFAVATIFALASSCSLLLFGPALLGLFWQSLRHGVVRAYGRVWRDMTRWSVLGVVTSEMTINAHAYLVTFIAGSRAFALIAVGALFTRPFLLVLTALPDREGPALARLIADGQMRQALRSAKEFALVIAGLWVANQFLAGAVFAWFPGLIAKKGYDLGDVAVVVAIWAVITAVRGARSADCLLLISAREFRALGQASVVSSAVAMSATLALLLLAGPVPSLLGILAGDLALWQAVRRSVRGWQRSGAIASVLATEPSGP